MGIDVINGGDVVYNDTHDNLVVTCSTKNPTIATISEMRVQSIFRRVKAKTRGGDGNPLIYALKRTRGFNIGHKEVRKLLPDFQIILDKALQGSQYDLIIPMPSSYGVSEALASRAFRTIGTGAIAVDLLRKKNNREVLAELHRAKIPKKLKPFVMSLCKKLETLNGAAAFSMKEVDSHLRPLIQPLTLTCDSPLAPSRILLVDDLVSSGATLVSARDSLGAVFEGVKIDALTLLSKIRKR